MTDIDYRRAGVFTALGDAAGLAAGLPDDPVGICAVVRHLVVQPDARTDPERLAQKDIRPVDRILATLGPAPLTVPREPAARVVGTCRHFAVLACALLRHRGIPARARCGFATYFVPGRCLDHWVTEYRSGDRWVRVDSEVLGGDVLERPDDLADGLFLTGGEAWTRYRRGGADPMAFGVAGTDHAWGAAEIRGNAIRDLAALCGHEMLPWDEWGRMTASYAGDTGPDYDALIDTVAATTAADDPAAVGRLYRTGDLAVPAEMLA
ncbi:MAG TPA: transglutaminase-like domain-containing protein [Actinocatenispora sp.]